MSKGEYAAVLVAILLAVCAVGTILPESDAKNIEEYTVQVSAEADFTTAFETITKSITEISDTDVHIYSIELSNDLTVGSLVFDAATLCSSSSDDGTTVQSGNAVKVTIRLLLNNHTLTISGEESYGILVSNDTSDCTLSVAIGKDSGGTIVDGRSSSTGGLDLIRIVGNETGTASKTAFTVMSSTITYCGNTSDSNDLNAVFKVVNCASLTVNSTTVRSGTDSDVNTAGVVITSSSDSASTNCKSALTISANSDVHVPSYVILSESEANVTTKVSSSTITSTATGAIYQNCGSIKLSSATVVGNNDALVVGTATVELDGSAVKGVSSSIETIDGTDKVSLTLSGDGSALYPVISSDKCTLAKGNYELVDYDGMSCASYTKTAVASIGDVMFRYLNGAMDFVSILGMDDATITILSDAATTKYSSLNVDLVVDLNGHPLTMTSETGLTLDGTSLEFKGDGTITSVKNAPIITLLGSSDSSAQNYTVLTIGEGVTLTSNPKSGESISYDSSTAIRIGSSEDSQYGVVVNIDGTVTAKNFAVYLTGPTTATGDNVPQINVSGTVRSTGGTTDYTNYVCAIYAAGYGVWNISGTVEGGTGIELRAGILNVTGGTITATSGTFSADADAGGTTVVGAGIALVQHTTKLDTEINISGGTIAGCYALYEDDIQSNGTTNKSMSVTGGTFNGTTSDIFVGESDSAVIGKFVTGGLFTADPASYVEDGYSVSYAGSQYRVMTPVTIAYTAVSGGYSATVTSEEGAVLYYTMDGNDPTSDSLVVKGAIEITSTCTLKVISKVGDFSSSVASQEFKVSSSTEGGTTTTTTESTIETGSGELKVIVTERESSRSSTTEITITTSDGDPVMTVSTSSTASETGITVTTDHDDSSGVLGSIDAVVEAVKSSTGAVVTSVAVVVTTDDEGAATVSNTAASSLSAYTSTMTVTDGESSVVFDQNAITNMGNQSGNVVITVKEAEYDDLEPAQQSVVGDSQVYELTVSVTGESYGPLGGTATVTVPVNSSGTVSSVTVYCIKDDGTKEYFASTYSVSAGTVTFTTTHFSIYMIDVTYVSDVILPDDNRVVVTPTTTDSSSSDDSVKIVACAAAAVAAAMMAAFIFVLYRRK